MLTLSATYSKKTSTFSQGYFNVVATPFLDGELEEFHNAHKTLLNKPVFTVPFDLKETQREMVGNLIYRFNLEKNGLKLLSIKADYLKMFSQEALIAIIYATDYYPPEMSIDDYVNTVLKAFAEYGDSDLFDERIINVCGVTTGNMFLVVGQQIKLFKNLLTVPNEEINNE